jgi:hypothetical protein
MTFHRPALAAQIATQLLQPTFLDKAYRSGLFLSGRRRVGKTTFLASDLIPALENNGAIVVYVDLWAQPQANPSDVVHAAIRATLEDLEMPGSAIIKRIRAGGHFEAGFAGFKFGFKAADVGKDKNIALAQVCTELVDQAKTNLVLIVDEVQHAMGCKEGDYLLHALKATRDAINLRPTTPGYFLFVGTGSHRARVQELAHKGNQAFNGAVTLDFPLLGEDFIDYVLAHVVNLLGSKLPTKAILMQAFEQCGHRPEELMKALHLLRDMDENTEGSTHLLTIARTLAFASADAELQKVEALGDLAIAVFGWICSNHAGKGMFSAEVISALSCEIKRDVTASDVQTTINALVAANLLMRTGHGSYAVTDSYLEKTWNEKMKLGGL